jgi:DNA-binding response OmpR family regulator
MAVARSYDAIVLDLMLPGLDGMSVLQELRKRGKHTLVLILTAKTRSATAFAACGGADDYLCKPFSFDELLARRASAAASRTSEETVFDRRSSSTSPPRPSSAAASRSVSRRAVPTVNPRSPPRERLSRGLEEHRATRRTRCGAMPSTPRSARCARRSRDRARKLIHTRRGFGYLLGEPGRQDVETE